MNEASSHHVFA